MPPAAFAKRRSDVVEIKGTANAATDTARLQAAVAAANAAGVPVTFHVSGSVYINALVTITAPVSWTFASSGELVRATAAGGILYGSTTPPWDSGTSYAVTATTAGGHTITSPNLALAPGDYVAIWAQNELLAFELTPHSADDRFVPLEIHRISRSVTGASQQYVFADFCDDACTTSPRIRKLSMQTGIRITGMRARALPGAYSESPAFLTFGYCADLELRDCVFGPNYPGALVFFCCYDVRRVNLRLGDVENPNTNLQTATGGAYGILDRVVTLAEVVDCTFGSIRHGYSTGAATRVWSEGISVFSGERRSSGLRIYQATSAGTTGSTAPTHTSGNASDGNITWSYVSTGRYRSGTVRAFRVAGCRAGINGVQTGTSTWSGLSPYDTHSEAIRGVFEHNEARMPNDSGNIGFSIRGRKIVIKNNTIYGSTQTIPVQISSNDVSVVGNTFIGAHRCEVLNKANTNDNPQRARFIGNTFIDFYNPAIMIEVGSDHVISGNRFVNCGYLWNSSPNIPGAAVYIKGLTSGTVTISGNDMPKYSNRLSIMVDSGVSADSVVLDGNNCTGYGDWNFGVRYPIWQEAVLASSGQMLLAGNKEYRITTGGTTGSTAPTHTSGTETLNGVAYQYVRTVNLAMLLAFTRKWQHRNGWPLRRIIKFEGHGLTPTDAYKPCGDNGTILDQTDNQWDGAQTPGYVLLDVLDNDHYLVAKRGELVDIPLGMINGSFSMTVATELHWQLALGKYTTSPSAGAEAGPVLRALAVDATHVHAEIL